MHLLILGRAMGLEKKNHKKSWNRRPGTSASLLWSLETTRHDPKINMAEKLVDVIVKLTQRGKKFQSPKLYVVTRLIFFTLKELYKIKAVQLRNLLLFFLKMPKTWVGRTKLNGEINGDGLKLSFSL